MNVNTFCRHNYSRHISAPNNHAREIKYVVYHLFSTVSKIAIQGSVGDGFFNMAEKGIFIYRADFKAFIESYQIIVIKI